MKNKQQINGSVSELICAADLATKGFEVFIPLNRHSSCDLVAMDDKGAVYRVEVKTGAGRPSYNQEKNDLFDLLANVKEDHIDYNGKYPFRHSQGKVHQLVNP